MVFNYVKHLYTISNFPFLNSISPFVTLSLPLSVQSPAQHEEPLLILSRPPLCPLILDHSTIQHSLPDRIQLRRGQLLKRIRIVSQVWIGQGLRSFEVGPYTMRNEPPYFATVPW